MYKSFYLYIISFYLYILLFLMISIGIRIREVGNMVIYSSDEFSQNAKLLTVELSWPFYSLLLINITLVFV